MADPRQQVVQALNDALASTPVAHCIDFDGLMQMVRRKYDDLCKGNRFDFGPVYTQLLSMEGVTETGIYVGFIRFKSVLAGLGVSLTEPNWTTSEEVRRQLMRQARAAQQHGGQQHTQKVADIVADRPKAQDNVHLAFSPGGKRGPRGRTSPVRIVIYLLLVIGCGLGAWRAKPIRDLNTSAYAQAFPLTKVQVHDGVFVGFADMAVWRGMDPAARALATEALQALLAKEGYLGDAAVFDEKGSMIVFDIKGKRLEIANNWKK